MEKNQDEKQRLPPPNHLVVAKETVTNSSTAGSVAVALREVNDQLRQTPLGRHIVFQRLSKRRVSQGLGQALAQGLTCARVI